MPAQIKHLFVLMMENRSFDHLFGFMKTPGYNIEGLDPAALPLNEDSLENEIYASSDARPTGDLAADPNHHFADVTEQLYGVSNPDPGQVPDISGFVRNYETKYGAIFSNCMASAVSQRVIFVFRNPTAHAASAWTKSAVSPRTLSR
jgi:hypothetical protein